MQLTNGRHAGRDSRQRLDPFNSVSWSADEREYFESVERAFLSRDDTLISNGRPEHAAYLIKLMLANARRHVRLVSGGLTAEEASN